MKTPLYINWNIKQSVKVPIIDEQHHTIVSNINALYFSIHQGWAMKELTPTLKLIQGNVCYHLETEEHILEKLGANYKIMVKHSELSNNFIVDSDKALKEALNEQDPMILLKFLRDWWLKHHLEDHETYHTTLSSIKVEDTY